MGVLGVFCSNFPRVFEVFVEHVLDLVSEAAIDCQQGNLEVQAERAVVQVGTPNRADVIIHQHHLLMQKPGLVTEHTYPRAHRFEGKQAGGGVDDAVVRP